MKRRVASNSGKVGFSGPLAQNDHIRQQHRTSGRRGKGALVWMVLALFAVSLALLLIQPDTSPRTINDQSKHTIHMETLQKGRHSPSKPPFTIAKAKSPPPPSSIPSIEGMSFASSTSCAICFFGLPRSFQLLVLPSIVQNVLKPNQKSTNRCDIYLHYYKIDSEGKSRSSVGGTLIEQLYNQDSNEKHQHNTVHLSIVSDNEASFQQQRGQQLQKYMTAKGPDGKPLYYPWMAKSYDKNSITNMIKQWHSISQVWSAMEHGAMMLQRNYTRVAMLRNDVVYVTPFDIYQVSNTTRDDANQLVVVPNWARFPINDRMVYGPHTAVKIWATERFERLETHVRTYSEPGYGLHSERFLNHSIFPPIRDLGYTVTANPELCFFRARADGTAWINDCATRDGAAIGFRNLDMAQRLVEELVGHSCIRGKFKQRIVQVDCTSNGTKT
jgi:hypothetical protein